MSDPAAEAAYARAVALLDADRPRDALRELATLPAGEAVSARAFELRGMAFLALDQWDDAADAARRGLAAGGPDPDLLNILGDAEHRRGDLRTAERALLDGLALQPTDVDLLCSYARLCVSAGQLPKATQLVQRAATEQPHAPTVYATRAQVAFASGDDKAAQRISREFVAMYPEHPGAHALLGGASAARGQVDQAYSGFRQAVSGRPSETAFAEAALESRIAKHPLMIPMRPIMRFGALPTWVAAIAVIFGLRALGQPVLAMIAGAAWILLCVYSWVVPPLLTRRMKRRWSGSDLNLG